MASNKAEMTPASPETKSQRAVTAFSFASVGLEMGVAVFLGWALGQWLDQKFDTEPWLMLVFVLAGVGAGLKAILRAANQARSQFDESNQ